MKNGPRFLHTLTLINLADPLLRFTGYVFIDVKHYPRTLNLYLSFHVKKGKIIGKKDALL